jgi:uncharacterized membrane protein SirB2
MAGIGDTVFELTEWLRTTPMVDFALWLSAKEICEWVQSHSFMVPVMQMIHLFAIAMGFGSVVLFNLRLVGRSGGDQTVAQSAHRYLPWMKWSLLVLFISGIGMVLGDPVRLLVNPVFWMKITLFVIMILVSIVHLKTVTRKIKTAPTWDATSGGTIAIRSSAYGLIILWLLIMAGGRFMAYAPM